jgi:hypothetical protein
MEELLEGIRARLAAQDYKGAAELAEGIDLPTSRLLPRGWVRSLEADSSGLPDIRSDVETVGSQWRRFSGPTTNERTAAGGSLEWRPAEGHGRRERPV